MPKHDLLMWHVWWVNQVMTYKQVWFTKDFFINSPITSLTEKKKKKYFRLNGNFLKLEEVTYNTLFRLNGNSGVFSFLTRYLFRS